jgi:predicted dehydrogenase/threonine dehydrogenase-like Zn-dependent dehydrogenase
VKQVSQRLKDGRIQVIDVPTPELDDWKVLVRTSASLVSPGTERAKVEVGRESLLGKALRRPDQVRQVMDKVSSDGVRATLRAVQSRLEALSPLGYSAVGRVEQVGPKVSDIRPGQLVACGGEEAAHSAVMAVPGNLCSAVPDGVSPQEAAFTTLGAIAMHGLRQANVGLGDRVAVIGLGLVGQLSARLARAAGCEVIGVDLEQWRVKVADTAGALDVPRLRSEITRADGDYWDAVLVTAAAPNSNDPLSVAIDLARERGTIVVVGDVRIEAERRRLYSKEIQLRIARSYGPGRYDREYEQRGLDYPIGYVRWTERRNMAEFLRLLATKRVKVDDLVTHRFTIDRAAEAFDVVTDRESRALGVIIEYPLETSPSHTSPRPKPSQPVRARERFVPGPRVGFIGAGGFAQRTLIPLAQSHGLVLERVATASGMSAVSAAERFGFARDASEVDEVLADRQIAGVFVATRHDLHGQLTLDVLRAGKAVFVEKPLCLTEEELNAIQSVVVQTDAPPLLVGFNRRYAPLTLELQDHLRPEQGPTNVVIRVNAGPLAADHWLNDPLVGGGRLAGEGCHFLDLICALTGTKPIAVVAQARSTPGRALQTSEDFSVSIRFDDGSLGALLYGTTGAAGSKEIVEAHRGSRSARIDDFRSARFWGGARPQRRRLRTQDKGHSEEMRAFAAVVRGEADAPAVEAALASTRLTLAALRSLGTGVEEQLSVPDR